MGSELQAALKGDMVKTAMPNERIDEDVDSVIIPTEHWGAMRKAARKVANLDYKAATAEYQRMIEWDMEGADWNYEEYAHNIVDAALGITEAPDGQ